ncbi:MAG: hypothetical protein ACKOBW_13705, partial [Planctomycetota bacterium]
ETKWSGIKRASLHSHELCQREIKALDNHGFMITNFVNEEPIILDEGQEPAVGRYGHGVLFGPTDPLHILGFSC